MMNTIFFDLDGTLAPFMQDDFIRGYFGALIKLLGPMGYEKDALVAALWKGTMAMIQNNGSSTNEAVFWEIFEKALGSGIRAVEPVLDEFYRRDFDAVRAILVDHPNRKPLVELLRAKGYTVVLATNPIFPAVAVETRLRWVGLRLEDFDYVTTYENSCFCKPNPDYYRALLREIGKAPEECLMIGNNPVDDMAALEVGISGYLVTDCMENPDNRPIDCYRHSTFREAEAYLASLPDISGCHSEA